MEASRSTVDPSVLRASVGGAERECHPSSHRHLQEVVPRQWISTEGSDGGREHRCWNSHGTACGYLT